MRFLRILVLKFLASFARPIRGHKDLKEAAHEEKEGAWKITLSDRSAIKSAAIKEWSKPENIKARMEELEKEAPKALERGQLLSKKVRTDLQLPIIDPPLPDPLPDRFKGQQESTIRAMLRHEQRKYSEELEKWML
jgi:hypothetical protein